MSSETQSSNPKHKYRQKNKEGSTTSAVEHTHRQKAPLLLTMDNGPVISKDEDITVDASREDMSSESAETLSYNVKEFMGGSLQDAAGEELIVDEVSAVNIDRTVNIDGSIEVGFTDQDNQTGIQEEDKLRTEDGVDQSNDLEVTGAHYLEDDVSRVQEGHESDEEEKKAILAEENVLQLEEAEKEQLSILDSLTGCPVAEDVLLYAIPVCAPYSSLLNYKFKAKLVPGTSRRGKAAKTAVHRFTQSRECTQTERDLLKTVKDNDLSR